MRSLEADANKDYSITHGLYQSLESEKVNRVSREPIDTCKQFESIEPSNNQLNSYDQVNRHTTEKRSPPRKAVRKMLGKYGY